MKLFLRLILCTILLLNSSALLICQSDTMVVHLKDGQKKIFIADDIIFHVQDRMPITYTSKDITTIIFQNSVFVNDNADKINSNLFISPNPLSENMQIKIEGCLEGMNIIDIINNQGVIIYSIVFYGDTNNTTAYWDGYDNYGNEQSNGLYFFRLSNKLTYKIGKLIITK